ncbi:MAG: tyrosine-type recombinase/integrase [Nitrososphaerota archaeon]|nr:tyrosine-type recombinase/integrase [Nitrososphaerota archaeon]
MSRAHEIYPLEREIEKELKKISRDPRNGEIITRYYKVRSTQIALATQHYVLCKLRRLSEMLNKKFEDATLQDIENLHFELCRRWKCPNTRNKYRKILKAFYQWMEGCNGQDFPPRVRWIKTERVPLVAITEDDLISFEDARKICNAALNPRDRALFSCQLDAGCRIGEILTVRVGEVKVTDDGAVLDSDGKTGRHPIILTWATPILSQWLDFHPFRTDPNAPLFIRFSKSGKPIQMAYSTAATAFQDCAKRAGMKKHVWLHLLKHVSSTQDALNGMPDSFRRYKHHWSQGSKMPAVYEHLSKEVIPKIQQETWRLMENRSVQKERPNELRTTTVESVAMELIRILKQNPEALKLLSTVQG